MDIKIISTDEPTNAEKAPEQISGPVTPELMNKAVHQVMGLETEQDQQLNQDEVGWLLDYAKSQTDDHSPQNIKWVIRSLELKLGTPPLAEKRIKWLARYAYLSTERRKLDKELKQFEQL